MLSYTIEDVAKHSTSSDAWIIVDGAVLDVSSFAKMHPGGTQILLEFAGQDCTEVFYSLHRQDILFKYMPRLMVGTLKGSKVPAKVLGASGVVPFSEPSFWHGWKSPFFNQSHKDFRTAVRAFMDEHIAPKATSMDDMDKAPTKEMFKLAGAFGLLACRLGPGKHLEGFSLPSGIKFSDFDYFHEMIAHEEVYRLGTPGFSDGFGCGMVIGLPAVLNFCKGDLRDKVCRDVLSGEKQICLAISEPFAGSDVAGIQARASLSSDGKHYIVNGTKKWITNGTFCDYFVTAVRTGGKGIGGISLLLIERGPGVDTLKIKTSYSGAAGTAYVVFEDVKVPVENLLGKENQGFKCIMANFNHERWFIVVLTLRLIRLVIEECFKWANQRKVFGKPLISQPVIRNKLAHMVAQLESVQSWLESITYQMNKMTYKEQTLQLAGPLALCKLQATRVSNFVNDEACQIFGGRAITRTGMGQVIERFQRSVKFAAILGGSEEIMADLGIRQSMRGFPSHAKL